MIDYSLRAKYSQQLSQQNQNTKFIKDAFNQVEEAVQLKKDINTILDILQTDQKKNHELFSKLGRGVAMLFNKIPAKTVLPSIFKVKGDVNVTNPVTSVSIKNFSELEKLFRSLEQRISLINPGYPEVEITNLDEMGAYFKSLEQKLAAWTQAAQAPPPISPKIEFPKITFPKQEKLDLSPLLDAIGDLKDSLTPSTMPDNAHLLRRMADALDAFVSTPRLTPQPVTNITINPLNGFIETTDNTVGTTIVTLPNYGQLFNRRAVQIYNNSSNTIYIGGSDVTTSTGFPVPSGSYAPTLDAGYDLPIYAIASQSGNDVRVIEISKDKTGNIQE